MLCASPGGGMLVVACLAASVAAAGESEVARVTYLTGSSAYVDAGERDGLGPGSRLRAVGAGGQAVVLEVVEVSPHRAACKVVGGTLGDLAVGSSLLYEAAPLAPAAVAEESATGPGAWRRSGLHGRVGLRYLLTRDGLNEDADFEQPAVDLRLDGPALFGSPWSFHADVRARRTTREVAGGADDSDSRSRVYRLAAGWDGNGPGWRFGVGRQYSPELANVSIFDGAVAGYDGKRWSVGVFGGTQPDGEDFGYSSRIREYGAFAGWRSGPGTGGRWSLTTGAVASYDESEINREYVYVQGRYGTRRVSAFVTQEVDLNRDWKEAAGESTLEPTSTYASVRFSPSDRWSLFAGLDNRRDVRLWRDQETPETEFDDAFRRAAWAGASLGVGQHVRLGVDGRTSRGGDAGQADAFTVSASVVRLTAADLALRLRATRFENERLEGWLYAADLGLDLGTHVRLALSGGLRDEASLFAPELDDSVSWYGLDLDVDLGGRLYATLALERASGEFEDVDQAYATLACRF